MATHLLSLKVLRVISKEVSTSHFMSGAEYDDIFREENSFEQDKLPDEYAEKWQIVPKKITHIYLGETFSFCAFCVNDSVAECVKDVELKVDLQLFSNRIVNVGVSKAAFLDAKQTLNDMMHHEVKEMGNHVLICTVNYKSASDEEHSLRKFFRFQVDKPLDVKTKFYNAEDFLSDEVYLEALLQNLTTSPICLEQVLLEPSHHFQVKDMNKIKLDDGREELIFGKPNRLNSNECRQYLFCLTPKTHPKQEVNSLKSVTVIGKLDVMWTSGIGASGHLQTSQLERMAPVYNDIRLTVEKIPSQVNFKKKFNLMCRITNCCDYEMVPCLHLEHSQPQRSILWLGISGKVLGNLKPMESIDFPLTAFPVQEGIQPIPKIRISDVVLKNNYDFEEIAYVFVRASVI